MRSPTGRFSRPVSLAEALRIAADDPERSFVAGNTDLGVVTNLRDHRYPHLISLDAVAELREFHESEEAVEIGAALTLTEIGELWREPPPVFREWLPVFASPLIRNRATLGGNLATASPIGDAAPLLLALGAVARISGLTDERLIPLQEFFPGYRRTALPAVKFCARSGSRSPSRSRPFLQGAKRRLDDISTVAAVWR